MMTKCRHPPGILSYIYRYSLATVYPEGSHVRNYHETYSQSQKIHIKISKWIEKIGGYVCCWKCTFLLDGDFLCGCAIVIWHICSGMREWGTKERVTQKVCRKNEIIRRKTKKVISNFILICNNWVFTQTMVIIEFKRRFISYFSCYDHRTKKVFFTVFIHNDFF